MQRRLEAELRRQLNVLEEGEDNEGEDAKKKREEEKKELQARLNVLQDLQKKHSDPVCSPVFCRCFLSFQLHLVAKILAWAPLFHFPCLYHATSLHTSAHL